MEHLLRRVGFAAEAVFGDFYRNELKDDSEGMIWVARNPEDWSELERSDKRSARQDSLPRADFTLKVSG